MALLVTMEEAPPVVAALVAAALCVQGCNPACPRLQPYACSKLQPCVPEPATLMDPHPGATHGGG
eukprot:scaffold135659_cov178-Phaeocystis_antarctica.AAC.1